MAIYISLIFLSTLFAPSQTLGAAITFDRNILYAIILTLVPSVELRGSIPLILLVYKESLYYAILIIGVNILITPIVFLLWDLFLAVAKKINFLNRFVNFYLKNLQKRSQKTISKYGFWGLMFFVAVPLPGTGAYTGALIAEIFGMNKLKAFIAISLGVIIAGLIVTLAVLGIIPLRIT